MFGAAPTRVDGRKTDLSWLKSNLTFDEIRGAAEFSLSCGGANVPSLRTMVRKTDVGRIFYAVNLSDKSAEGVTARFANCGKVCGLDMGTLKYFALRGERKPDSSEVTLDFEPGQSYVFAESDEAPDSYAKRR